MSRSPGDPNDVPLREYVEALMTEHLRAHAVEHSSDMEDRKQRAEEVEHRLDSLNELRATYIEDRAQFLRGDVYDQKHSSLMARVEILERQAIKDAELHASAREATAKAERQRKWLAGLTVTVVLAIAAIVANVIINLSQGIP